MRFYTTYITLPSSLTPCTSLPPLIHEIYSRALDVHEAGLLEPQGSIMDLYKPGAKDRITRAE